MEMIALTFSCRILGHGFAEVFAYVFHQASRTPMEQGGIARIVHDPAEGANPHVQILRAILLGQRAPAHGDAPCAHIRVDASSLAS